MNLDRPRLRPTPTPTPTLAPTLALALALALATSCGEAAPAADPADGAHAAVADTTSELTTTPAARPAAGAETPATRATPPLAGAPGAADEAWFEDVSAAWGLDFVHDAGLTEGKRLAETMGAGAVLADLDGDGSLDAYLVQSGPLPIAPRDPTLVNRLYLNRGDGHLTDATARSGDGAHPGYGMGCASADVDGDGDLDLLVTNFGPDVLLLNDGHGHFSDDTARAGLGDPRWTGAAGFFDADADGDPDLYVGAYVDEDLLDPPYCGRREPGARSYCHPDVYPGLPDRFYVNDGAGVFSDVTVAAGLASDPADPGKGLGVLPVDLDGDADLDLYVANDSVRNRLWLNDGQGQFEDGTLLSGTGVNDRGMTEAGMGLAAGDLDGDGDAELFVTNFDDESNTLYRNDGDGLFTDVTAQAGLDAASRLPVGFGTVLADLDGDGDLDVAVTNGHIIDNIELYHDGKTHAQRGLLFANDGAGRFSDQGALGGPLTDRAVVGRGLYSGDLDGDGRLDLLLTTNGGPALLLANRRATPGLIIAGLRAGSRVLARLDDGRQLTRWAGPQPSYFGQTSPRLHLGTGGAAVMALTVTEVDGHSWPLTLDPPLTSGSWALRSSADGPRLVDSAFRAADGLAPGDPHR